MAHRSNTHNLRHTSEAALEPMRISKQQFRKLPLAVLVAVQFIASAAISQTTSPSKYRLNCYFLNSDGEKFETVVSLIKPRLFSIVFKGRYVEVMPVRGEVISLPNYRHSAGSTFVGLHPFIGSYTLVVHRPFGLPHPPAYDASRPPATLTIQKADENLVPIVEVWRGHCQRAKN